MVPAPPAQMPSSFDAPSLISSRQKMWRRGSGAGGNGILAHRAFSSGIRQSWMRRAAMPADSGW